MKSIEYFKQNLMFSIITSILFLLILNNLVNYWFSIQVFLTFAYLLIITIGVFGLANKKKWSPGVFITLFSIQAINFLVLLIPFNNIIIKIAIFTSILALYYSAEEADILIKIRKFQYIKKKIESTKKKTSKKLEIN